MWNQISTVWDFPKTLDLRPSNCAVGEQKTLSKKKCLMEGWEVFVTSFQERSQNYQSRFSLTLESSSMSAQNLFYIGGYRSSLGIACSVLILLWMFMLERQLKCPTYLQVNWGNWLDTSHLPKFTCRCVVVLESCACDLGQVWLTCMRPDSVWCWGFKSQATAHEHLAGSVSPALGRRWTHKMGVPWG